MGQRRDRENMPAHRVPLDRPQTNILVDINDRPLNVHVADAKPYQVEGEAAYLSYAVNPEESDSPFIATRTGIENQYRATLFGEPTFLNMINVTDAALRLMNEDDVTSVIIPLTAFLAKRLELEHEHEILVLGALLGIREFTDMLREKDIAQGISEIIVAASSDVFQTWYEKENLKLHMVFGDRPENEEEGEIKPLVQPARQPDEIQRSWLELIGNHLDGFHESGDATQSISGRPKQLHMTVIFEASTGVALAITDHMSPIELEGLNPGEAAIDVEYVKVDNKAMIIVGRHLVGNLVEQPSQEVQELIRGVRAFAPIFPQPKASDAQPSVMSDELAASNDAMVMKMLAADSDNSDTRANEVYVAVAGAVELATWWTKRSSYSFEDLHDMVVGRLWSRRRYTFSIDQNGRFVGGVAPDVPSKAMNVEFRTFKGPSDEMLNVPVHYEWHGPEGQALEAFKSWYHSSKFSEARGKMVIDDILSKTMFPGKGPFDRICSLLAHLSTKPADYERTSVEFNKANGLSFSVEGLFDLFIEGLMRIARSKSQMSAKKEMRIAFLEMVMRRALGDEAVNEILWKGSGGSPANGGGVTGDVNGSESSAGGNGSSTMGAAQSGDPDGWRMFMAPPPRRDFRGIVREKADPTEDADTVKMDLSDEEIAAIMAAEQSEAATEAFVTSTEAFIMATAPVTPVA